MTARRFFLEARYLVEFLLLWPVVALVRAAPEWTLDSLIRGIATVARLILAHDRRWCEWNIDLIFGERRSPADRRRLAKQSFENIVRTRVELMRFTPEWMTSRVIEVGGEQARAAARQAKAEGRGMIILTCHLGNFELLAAWVYHTGFRGPVMYRPLDNWRVERLFLGSRAAYLPDVVKRGAIGTMSFMYSLREGEGVGMLLDINTLSNPVFVDFLGYAAASPPGPAALALATDATVILCVAVRQPDGRHRLTFHEPFPLLRSGDKKKDIEANTRQYTAAIEPYLLAHPEQYNWPHPRWRLRPNGSFWTSKLPVEIARSERLRDPFELSERHAA